MAQKKTTVDIIHKLTKGIVSTTIDVILLELLVIGDFMSGPPTINRSLDQIQKHLCFLEKQKLKTAFCNAKIKGWIDQKGLLTELGKTKINSKIPHYQPQEKWLGTWFIVMFDIPEKQRGARNIFRSYLKEKRFGKLQESIWISPQQHCRSKIETLKKTYGLEPFVYTLLTKSIGEIPSIQLAEKVWGISDINKKYQEYIQEYSDAKANSLEGVSSFLAIASEDPQLPNELLPAEWKGKEAFQLYLHIYKRRPS